MRITSGAIVVILSSALSSFHCEAFVTTPSHQLQQHQRYNIFAPQQFSTATPPPPSLIVLKAEEGEDDAEEASDESDEKEESDEEEEPKEDPEVTSLKEEIASLEKKLSEKRLEKNTLDRLVDNYSENGYARKVAEMENVRKLRSLAFIDNKSTAKAAVVQSFLPVLDALTNADAAHSSSPFTSNYSALRGNFNTALKELDVTEYTAQVGSKVDKSRILVKQEVYSDDYDKDVVVQPLAVGYEIKGNVMRMAECVASLGSEEDANKQQQQQEQDATTAKDESGESQEGSEDGSFE